MQRIQKRHPIIRRIEDDLLDVLEKHGYELVDAKYGGRGNSKTLSVYIDQPGGVSAAQCSDIAEQLSVLLDVLDPVPGSYRLVVSSPGVERPLIKHADFERFTGRKASVSFREEEKTQTWEGKLRGMEDLTILLEVSDEIRKIPADAVEEAHLVFDPDLAKKNDDDS